MPFSDGVLACPRCRTALRELHCQGCGAPYQAPEGIPDLRIESDERTRRVREFYADAPFPNYPPRDSLGSLRARASRSEFARLLDDAVPRHALVLEMGCGTGQLSLFLASGGRTVFGADLARPSLLLAAEAARRYRLTARFVETDLRTPGFLPGAFDVIICSGVLHHTPNPRASFAAVAQLLRPGGVLVVGVYHAFARLPLRLRRAVARLTGFHLWDPVLRDRRAEPERRTAWLRDQYAHPEEHRHTVREVKGWFRENGFEYLRSYPSTLLGEEPGDLFLQSEDDFWPEALLAQAGWMRSLGGEGGLFVAVGARPT